MLLLGITGVVEGITMSIEKLSDLSKVYVEKVPYTQIFNTIIEGIKDNDAFRLYCYLSAKSRDWTVIKEWTAKQCNVGERKAKQCWSYLERCSLLEYIQIRNDIGKFIKHDMRILNGSKFNPNEPFMRATGAETAPVDSYPQSHWCNYPPSGETTRVGFAPLLNKDLTNKDFVKNKHKSFCRSDEQKKANEKKPAWSDKPKSPLADVTKQTTSHNSNKSKVKTEPNPMLKEFMEKNKTNDSKKSTQLPTSTEIQPKIPTRDEPGVQGATIDARGCKGSASTVRSSDGLLEARSAHSYFETLGLADSQARGKSRMASG